MILTWQGHTPKIGAGAFVAPNATVLGQVILGEQASIWYGSVLRGDVHRIRIGARTNIQDLSVVHVTMDAYDVDIGPDVTVGHRAILHGCTVADHVLVGMGAVLMDGSRVGAYSLVGAGALVTPGTEIPPGSLALGSPARVVRELTDDERRQIDFSAQHYVDLISTHREAVEG